MTLLMTIFSDDGIRFDFDELFDGIILIPFDDIHYSWQANCYCCWYSVNWYSIILRHDDKTWFGVPVLFIRLLTVKESIRLMMMMIGFRWWLFGSGIIKLMKLIHYYWFGNDDNYSIDINYWWYSIIFMTWCVTWW